MNTQTKSNEGTISYQCPVCGNPLPSEPPIPRYDAPCSSCGSQVWCRRRYERGSLIALEVLPDRTPDPEDVDRVVESLVRDHALDCVVLDLSRVELVTSSFVARLVAMNKRIRNAGGRLQLCRLSPIVHEVFRQLHLDRSFEIASDGEEIAADCR